jgi:hypothetical protein
MTAAAVIIMPVHPPKFCYLPAIMAALTTTRLVMLVFCNPETRQELERAHPDVAAHPAYWPVVLTEVLGEQAADAAHRASQNSIVSLKKWVGLHVLLRDMHGTDEEEEGGRKKRAYEGLKYAAVMDADVELLSDERLQEACEASCVKDKAVVGGRADGVLRVINEASFELLRHHPDAEARRPELLDVYFWFSNVPVYDLALTSGFLRFIGFPELGSLETFLREKPMNWFVFDHVVYVYYCALEHGYRVIGASGVIGSLERVSNGAWREINDRVLPLYWIWRGAYTGAEPVAMLMHVDRG